MGKIRLIFKNGSEAVVEVEEFSTTTQNGKFTGFKAEGAELSFAFEPTELLFWQEL